MASSSSSRHLSTEPVTLSAETKTPMVESKLKSLLPEKLYTLLHSHLERISKISPLNVISLSWNHPLGIGDLVHNRNLSNYWEELCAGEPMQIQSICLLSSDKVKQAKLLLQHESNPSRCYFFDIDEAMKAKENTFDMARAKKSRFIVCSQKNYMVRVDSIYYLMRSGLPEYIQTCPSVINVSRSHDIALELLISQTPAESYLQSIVEMGGVRYFSAECGLNRIIFDSIIMGQHPWKYKGILISEEIATTSDRILGALNPDKAKAEFVNEAKSEFLLSTFSESKLDESFFRKNAIGFGFTQYETMEYKEASGNVVFTQSTHQLQQAILTLIGQTSKNSFIVITNINEEEKNFSETFNPSSEFLNFLESEGIGLIKLGDKVIKIPHDSKNSKELTLINCKGISEKDRIILTCICDVIIGAGDGAYSDLFSRRGLPYFQTRYWKISYFLEMLADIRENFPDFEVLSDYIKIMIAAVYKNPGEVQLSDPSQANRVAVSEILSHYKYTHKEYLDLVREHHVILLKQYLAYQKFVHEKRNIAVELNHFLIRSIMASVLNTGNDIEINNLLSLSSTWEFMHPSSFLLFAIQRNNTKLLSKFYEAQPTLFASFIHKKHPNAIIPHENHSEANVIFDLTPLEIMLKNRDFTAIKLMVKNHSTNKYISQKLKEILKDLKTNKGVFETLVKEVPEIRLLTPSSMPEDTEVKPKTEVKSHGRNRFC